MSSLPPTAIATEFSDVCLGDARRDRRARKMLTDLSRNPELSFPKTWCNTSELEASYRFFSNENVEPKELVDAHATKSAIRAVATGCRILVLHDTSEVRIPLYFDDLRRNQLGKKSSRQQGFDIHVSFAVADDKAATPLGTLALQPFIGKDEVPDDIAATFWRDRGGLYDNEMKRWRDGVIDAQEKLLGCESAVVHVGDRELGRYNMLGWMTWIGAEFVVRAALDQLHALVGGKRLKLPAALASEPWKGSIVAELAARPENRGGKAQKSHPSRRNRKATLHFRARTIDLVRPQHKDSGDTYNPMEGALPPTQTVNVVEVLELHPPSGEPAVHWVLVTTLPIETATQQLDIIQCYRRRWIIEEFFRALKQGCKFESRQLESAWALLVALALLLPIAWSLLRMQTAALESPDAPWRNLFARPVLTAIQRLAPYLKLTTAATVRQVYLAIAKLGGHLKRNGMPGWHTLIHGLSQVVIALKAMNSTSLFCVAINA